METKKIKTWAGDSIQKVASDAVMIANLDNVTTEFDFNGVRCLCDATTDADLLVRDYMNAHLMEWKTIGPATQSVYSPDVQAELDRRIKAREEESERSRREYQQKMNERQRVMNERIAGIKFAVSDQSAYDSYVEKNTDPYGAGIIHYATQWGRLMQSELAQGKSIAECAEITSHEADTEGITGFMYGAAVSMLAQCWQHGEELRNWHNSKHGYSGKGTVNPAVLTINPA